MSALSGVIQSYTSMLKTVGTYDEQCNRLQAEVAHLVSTEDQGRLDTHRIASRVEQELHEATARAAKQSAHLSSLRMELTKVFAENSRAETQEEQRLVVLSSDAAAKRVSIIDQMERSRRRERERGTRRRTQK